MYKHEVLDKMSREERQIFAAELRKSLSGENGFLNPFTNRIEKATTSTGMVSGLGLLPIPLEAPASLLYPTSTPLRNSIPRNVTGGPAVNFRKVTGINTAKLWGSVAEATSATSGLNSAIGYAADLVTVNYKSVSMNTLLTPEAQFGSRSSIASEQDFGAEEFAILSLLQSTMLAEEYIDLGGCTTALGTPATPTALSTQGAAGTGTLTPGATYSVKVSALNFKGYLQGAKGNGGADADGETIASNVLTVTIAGSAAGSDSLSFKWAATYGAAAYNVYAYTSTTVRYVETVTVNTYVLKALGSSTNVINTADKTATATDYNGILQMCTATTAGYRSSLDGATLTADGTTGVSEISALFLSLFNAYKIGPDKLLMGGRLKKKVDSVVAGSTAPVLRIDATAGDLNITGTIGLKSIMNPFMNVDVPIEIHPWIPDGMILAPVVNSLGAYYQNARIGSNLTKYLGWDYRKFETFTKRAREMNIDFNGALVNHADFAFASISNVG